MQHEGAVRSAQFSKDGRRLVTASLDRTVRQWDGLTGQPAGLTLRLEAGVLYAAYNSTRRDILTWADNDIVQFWEAATGAPVGSPIVHQLPLLSISYSPDGRRIATSCRDRALRLFEWATLGAIGEPIWHNHWAYKAIFSPDSNRLVAAYNDGIVQVWDVTPRLTVPSDPELATASLDLLSGLNLEHQPTPTALAPEEIAARWRLLDSRGADWLEMLRKRNAPRTLEAKK